MRRSSVIHDLYLSISALPSSLPVVVNKGPQDLGYTTSASLKASSISSVTSKPTPYFFALSCACCIISGINLNSGGCASTTSQPKRVICRIRDCGTEIGLLYEAAYAQETTTFWRLRDRKSTRL